MSDSVMIKPVRTFQGTFLNAAFIRNAESFFRTFSILMPSRWESFFDIPVTCPSMIIHKFYSNMHGFDYTVPHFFTRVRGTRIVVTTDLISEVLHVSRVSCLNYPNYHPLMMCLKMNSCLYFVRHPYLEVNVKKPLTWALQKVRGS